MASGLMLSPENLVLVGRLSGGTVFYGAVLMAAGASVHLVFTGRYRSFPDLLAGPAGDALLIQSSMGFYPAVILTICPRVLTAVCVATAVLVSSGFIFNEVVLHWFPNFAFAGILLVVILVVNLFRPGVSEKAQALFAGTAVCGLVYLIGAGLLEPGQVSGARQPLPDNFGHYPLVIPLLIYVGYEAAFVSAGRRLTSGNRVFQPMAAAVTLSCLLFAAWGAVSTMHVSPARLASTTIPHILAAKAILGQTGRLIMAAIVVSGSCAAVNALFAYVSTLTAEMAQSRLVPGCLKRSWIVQVILALSVALMMATGMAGSEKLDTYLRAGLLLWLVCHAAAHLSFMAVSGQSGGRRLIHGSAVLVTLISVGVLAGYDPAPGLLAAVLALIAGVVWLFMFLWVRLQIKNGVFYNNKGGNREHNDC